MRKTILFTVVLCLAFATTAFAEMKIGVINLQQIIATSTKGKQAKSRVDQKMKGMEAKLMNMQKDIEKFQKDMQKQSMALSKDAQAKKFQEYRSKLVAFEQMRKQSQDEFAKAQKEIIEPVVSLLVKTAQNYAAKKGYDLIINASNTVLYATKKMDLTDEILKAFNAAK